MHWKVFYYKNALEVILHDKCIGNVFPVRKHNK